MGICLALRPIVLPNTCAYPVGYHGAIVFQVLQCSGIKFPSLKRNNAIESGKLSFLWSSKRWHASTLHVPLATTLCFAKEILLSNVRGSGKLNRSPLLTRLTFLFCRNNLVCGNRGTVELLLPGGTGIVTVTEVFPLVINCFVTLRYTSH